MKVAQMIEMLQQFEPELECVLDDDWDSAISRVEKISRTKLEDDDTTGRLKKVTITRVHIG